MDKLKKALLDAFNRLNKIDEAAKTESRDLTAADYEAKGKILDEIEQIQTQIKVEERSAKTKEDLTKATTENPDANMKSDESKKGFRCLGEFMQAVAGAAKSDYRHIDPRLETRSVSGMSEGTPAEGGFLVGQDFTTGLIEKVYETGKLVKKCTRIPISATSNSLKMLAVDETSRTTGNRKGGIQVYRAAEATQATAKKPKFKTIESKLEKTMGFYYATDELLQDASALGALVTRWFGEEFGFKADDEIIRGSGAGECKGILNSLALVTQAKETGQAAKTITPDNLIKMWSRNNSKAGSTWYINTDLWPQLYTMSLAVGTGGVPVFVAPGAMANAPMGSILGRPIEEIEHCETLGTVGDIIFADFSEYFFIEKGGIQAAESIHIRFDYDETAFRFTWRTNGQPFANSAITPYKGTSTVSPFVALATRA